MKFFGRCASKNKKKFKIRPRQFKKALVIGLYAFVAIVTVIGIVAPAFQ